MKDPILLIDAILDVYDTQGMQLLPDGTTFCNLAVGSVCAAFGYVGFTGMSADQIVGFISNSNDWQQVAIPESQELANQGSLLIAGLNSSDLKQAHGHVCIIRPGKETYSGKWGKCPRVLNIGSENFIARAKHGPLTNQPAGLNEAFVPLPKIWAWKPSL